MKKILSFSLITILIVFLHPFSYGQDFEVAPVNIDFSVEPGQSGTQMINIRNYGEEKEKFTFNVKDYLLTDEGKPLPKPAGSTKHSLADWITVNPSFFSLKPNESRKVEIKLTVPKGEVGSKWGMIKIKTAKEQEAKKADKKMATGLVVVPQITVFVKQAPESNTNFKGNIADLKEVDASSDSSRTFEVKVSNTGDRILSKAKVWLSITDMKTAKEKRFKPIEVTLYPGKERTVQLELPEKANLEAGKEYALAAIFDFGHKKTLKGTQIMITGK